MQHRIYETYAFLLIVQQNTVLNLDDDETLHSVWHITLGHQTCLTSFLCVSIPLCPQLPIWVQHSYHHLSNHVAFEFFFSLLLVYLSFCLQSFHAKVHRISKHGDVSFAKWSSSICLSSFSLLRTSSLVTLSSQLSFSILLHIHISKASNLLSASTSTSLLHTVLHSRQSISLFSSLLPDSFYPWSEYLLCCPVSCIHPLMLNYLNIWIGSRVPLNVH